MNRWAQLLGLAVLLTASMVPTPVLARSTDPSLGGLAEATHEATHEHCGQVSVTDGVPSGGCPLHAVSRDATLLRAHFLGVESITSACASELQLRIDEDSTSLLYHQTVDGAESGLSCSVGRCAADTQIVETPWRAVVRGDVGYRGFRESMRMVLCTLETVGGTGSPPCAVNTPFTKAAYNHQYEFGLPETTMPGVGGGGLRCELKGRWLTEAGSVEIVNTDDL